MIAYGWDSVPVPNFLYDETLVSDETAARGVSGNVVPSAEAQADKFTCYITTKPTYKPVIN